MSLIIVVSAILFLINAVSGGSQVDLRLGDTDFFLGEKFVINAFQRRQDSLEGDEDNTVSGSGRGARLIGPKKYPTSLEERMLSAIHSDPGNYFDNEDPSKLQNREGRLIGSKRVPTGMEAHVLKDLSSEPDNLFDSTPTRGNMRMPRLIGPKKYPTQLEDHFLREVSPDVSNTFENFGPEDHI